MKTTELPLRGPLRALLIAAMLGGGCDRKAAPEVQLAEASRSVTMGTIADLGPHRLEATTVDEAPALGRSTSQTLEVLWGDWDNFRVRRIRDGRLRSEVRVLKGAAWSRTGQAPFTRHEDAELFRGELAGTWDAWSRALEPFLGRVALVEPSPTVVEGRPANRYRVTLSPEPESSQGRVHQPTALEGEVVLDKASAVRLLAHVEGAWLEEGDPGRERRLRLDITRSNFGVIPEIEDPAPRKGKRRKGVATEGAEPVPGAP